jgi:hypothetical protein
MEICTNQAKNRRSKYEKQKKRRVKWEKEVELVKRQRKEEQLEEERKRNRDRWNHRFRPNAEVAGDNSLNRLLPYDEWDTNTLSTQECSQDGTEQRPIRLLEDSSEEDEDSEEDDEALLQRWWNERRPEPWFVNEPDLNPQPVVTRRQIPYLDFHHIDHLLPENREDYIGPP